MQTSVTFISIGTAFLQFCGIILYQIYSLCRSCGGRRDPSNIRAHEEQLHAILDISSRFEHSDMYSAKEQPLIDRNDEPTY